MNKSLLAFSVAVLVFFSPQKASAQAQPDTLPTTSYQLKDLVVTSFRLDKKLVDAPASIAVAPAIQFLQKSAFTISNVLQTEPGIAMGGDGIWSTHVNVRGLGENRLVTLIDGFRMETATDLTASLSMLDVNDIERVEVIKGAQSSLYGTGAIGGIVNVINRDGHFASKPYFGSSLSTGFASVNSYFTSNLALQTGGEKWYLRLSGSYGNADDVRTPKGIMPNSQFTNNNISARLGFKPFRNHTLKIAYQRYYAHNVGIPGGDAFPGPAEARYKSISRQLINGVYEITPMGRALKSLRLSYFYQDNNRDVEVHPNTTTTAKLPNGNTQVTQPQLLAPTSAHKTHGAGIQTAFQFSPVHNVIFGADYFRRSMNSSRTKQILAAVLKPNGDTLKTNHIERGETPLPTSSFTSAGLYVQDEMKFLDEKMILSLGARMDEIWVHNDACYDVDYMITNGTRNDAPATQRLTYEENNTRDLSWSANLGILYKLSQQTHLFVNTSRMFRSPSLEERFKYIDLGNYVRLGNPNLKPENGYSADLGLRIWKQRFQLQASVFVNSLRNMVVEAPGKFVYRLTADSSVDTLDALVNSNVSRALLYGFDFKAEYNLINNLVLSLAGSYVRGRDTKEDTNLPMIPPLSGRFGARYNLPKIGMAELSLLGAARQGCVADGETATNGYMRLDFALSTEEFKMGNYARFQVFAGVDNITNTAYTNHLSTNRGSISIEPGRNFYLRLRCMFGN